MKLFDKKYLILVGFIFTSYCGYSQCCGDNVCDTLAGETAANCIDCQGISYHCPNTIGSFVNVTTLPNYTEADTSGYCTTVQVDQSAPKQVCFEYLQPSSGNISVRFLVRDNCSATSVSASSSGTSGGCSTSSSSGGLVTGWASYDINCSQISSGMSVGGSCAPDSVITVCLDITWNGNPACTEVYLCPMIVCTDQDCSSPNDNPGCVPFDGWTASGYLADPCDTTTGVAVAVSPCGNHFSYLWDDPLAQTDSMATGLLPGTYNVVITNDSLQCDTTISVVVPSLTPSSPIYVTESICPWDSIFLAGAYQTTAGVYNDTVVNGDCRDVTITTLTVEQIGACEPSTFIIPNVFTPNEDGPNDVFTVVGVILASVECDIYNRLF